MLEMLPYPSGSLHMGHVLNYTMGDVVTHFKRRHGYTVLRPMGFDSFGLPAENAAIKDGGHPLEITERNMEAIRQQMRRMGWAIDWQREVSAHEPTFYRWTQWLFLKFFEHGLAYRKEAPVNWCPYDQTVLANEHVVDGTLLALRERSSRRGTWRSGSSRSPRTPTRCSTTWRRSTGPSARRRSRRSWIGRSEGAEILFRVEELDIDIPVFTTRPDTLFGATFFVVAPESPLLERLVEGTEQADEVLRVRAHRRRAADRGARAAREDAASSPAATRRTRSNGEQIPIWVADYVLMEYGTGAIMAVPAHDERDREFAREVRPADRPGDRRGREADQLGAVRRAAVRRRRSARSSSG